MGDRNVQNGTPGRARVPHDFKLLGELATRDADHAHHTTAQQQQARGFWHRVERASIEAIAGGCLPGELDRIKCVCRLLQVVHSSELNLGWANLVSLKPVGNGRRLVTGCGEGSKG